MKKTMISMLLVVVAVAVQAQIMNVTSIQQVPVPVDGNTITQAVAISPQGDYVLLSSDTHRGLVRWDLSTSSATILTTDEGAGSRISISDDGQHILYRNTVVGSDRLRRTVIKSIDANGKNAVTLSQPSRDMQGFALQGDAEIVDYKNQISVKTLQDDTSTIINTPMVSTHHLKLYVTRNGKTSQLAPNGEQYHYIWASLSPDATHVLYYASGLGAFVCDLDGGNVVSMGDITAPQWWNDTTIIGMDDSDDGMVITSSVIVARTLDGQQQTLTPSDMIATYPHPAPVASKIVFSTPDGNIYLITVE